MATKSRSYSHSVITKIILFIVVIACFTGAATIFTDTFELIDSYNGDLDIVSEDNYFVSKSFMMELEKAIDPLTRLVGEYKNTDNILSGKTIDSEEIIREEENLYNDFKYHSDYYNSKLDPEQNREKFREVYKDELNEIRTRLINQDLKQYNLALRELNDYDGILYYANNGSDTFSNTGIKDKPYFKSFPSYLIFDEIEKEIYPTDINYNHYYYWITSDIDKINTSNSVVYLAFTEEFLSQRIEVWKENKELVINNLYEIAYYLLGLIIAFIFLVLVIGRNTIKDDEVQLNAFDKLYTDFNLVLFCSIIGLWVGGVSFIIYSNMTELIIPTTALMSTIGLILLLSLIRHVKNRSFFKHSIIFIVLYKLYTFFRDVYASGSVAVKVLLIVIGFPLLVALTFFMFPITIGIAAWLSLKKVKEFNKIKEGVEKIRDGDLQHVIDIPGKGEFSKLATDINSITDGLNMAVENEIKSERLKSELITNVSHDIRTPLTSIITYIDLIKREEDDLRKEQYIEILEQKANRLKILTDDLFEASKASSGSIPVTYEKIDIVSLITQGLGELDDKIKELQLEFKLNYAEKVYVKADGKLLWRVVENLLSNIFKYALKGSRVYIDIDDYGNDIGIIIKNISECELNIHPDELMERFKRGDEARTSQGSGLGLSIAKSLIDIQEGSFNIEIDGDLFKVVIKMPKYIQK